MDKLGAAMAATGVGGTGAVGVYGAYSMGAFGSSKTKGGGGEMNGWSGSLGEMTGTWVGEAKKCLKDIFPDWTKESESLPTIASSFNVPWEVTTETKGCIVYNWKKESKEKNWEGSKFNLVWTLSKDDSGFSIDLSGTVTKDGDVVFEGEVYLFGKKEDGKWKAVGRLGLKEKKLNKGDLKSKFPKGGGDAIPKKEMKNDYWDFLNGSGSQVQEPGNKEDNKWWSWKGVPSTDIAKFNYQLKNWSSNFGVWWDYFFGKDVLNMPEVIKNLNGNWS